MQSALTPASNSESSSSEFFPFRIYVPVAPSIQDECGRRQMLLTLNLFRDSLSTCHFNTLPNFGLYRPVRCKALTL